MARTVCTTDLQLYVRTDGWDGNSGLANVSGMALRTVQRAVEKVYEAYDLAGFVAWVNLEDGSYTDNVLACGRPVGGSARIPLVIRGNAANPGAVVLAPPGGHAIENVGGVLQVQDLELRAPGGYAIFGHSDGCTYYGNVRFGAAGQGHLLLNRHEARAVSNYAICGSARLHAHVTVNSFWAIPNITVSLLNTPAFAVEFLGVNYSRVEATGASFVGQAAGVRHLVHNCCYIETGGKAQADAFPGDQPGVFDATTWCVWT